MRIPQQFDAFVGYRERPSKNKCAHGVGGDDDRNERQYRIVDERPCVDRDLIETKGKRDQRCHDRMQAEKRGEGDENTD